MFENYSVTRSILCVAAACIVPGAQGCGSDPDLTHSAGPDDSLGNAEADHDAQNPGHDHTGHDHPHVAPDAGKEPEPGHESHAAAWVFSADSSANRWHVTVVDPADADLVVASLSVDELSALSGPAGNDEGPQWGDALPSTDAGRVFANASSVDRVAVFDANTRTLEALLDVGDRPLHLFNPNHGSEMWSHADGEGAFYALDQTTLAVSAPIVAARAGTGHGKLLYAEALGTDYYATNTNDPGLFPIDGVTRSVGDLISLCAVPCEDDPATAADESLLSCGGTHDKGYNPAMNYVFAECSGAARGHYAFVDASSDIVARDLVPMTGAISHSPGWEYILIIDGRAEANQIQIWDTGAVDHDGIAFDATQSLDGSPSARGTQYHQNAAGEWEAWIPQNEGTKVGVLNLATMGLELVEIGAVTPPPGAGHFNRASALGGGHFYTFNDAGLVIVDLATREVTQGPALPGEVSRIAFIDAGAHE
jgi:hypothetical protein